MLLQMQAIGKAGLVGQQAEVVIGNQPFDPVAQLPVGVRRPPAANIRSAAPRLSSISTVGGWKRSGAQIVRQACFGLEHENRDVRHARARARLSGRSARRQ